MYGIYCNMHTIKFLAENELLTSSLNTFWQINSKSTSKWREIPAPGTFLAPCPTLVKRLKLCLLHFHNARATNNTHLLIVSKVLDVKFMLFYVLAKGPQTGRFILLKYVTQVLADSFFLERLHELLTTIGKLSTTKKDVIDGALSFVSIVRAAETCVWIVGLEFTEFTEDPEREELDKFGRWQLTFDLHELKYPV